jgi:uncharacterized delta-60 repeat protein
MALYFKVDCSISTNVSIGCYNNSTTVDWGDGSPTQSFTGDLNHIYPTSGIYTATLTPSSGTFRFYTNNIIEINCTSNNVNIIENYSSNLTGLTVNNCTNLQQLNIYQGNNIQIGDLSTLTSLINLTLRGLYGDIEIVNTNVQNINLNSGDYDSLILTGCTNLLLLYTYNSPNLKDLDISTCGLLYNLNVSSCISLSGCTLPSPWTPVNPSGNVYINYTNIKNLILDGPTYSSGYIGFQIGSNYVLETISITNLTCYYFNCNYNPNLKSITFDTFESNNYLNCSGNPLLESITGNTIFNSYISANDNNSLTTIDVSNYFNNYINLYNNNVSYLNLPNNNIVEYNIQNNNISSYNYINFSTVERIYLNNNSIGSSVFTSLLETGYLSGAVNVFLNILGQDPLFNPSQNALSFINLLINTRGWTILYTPAAYPTYAGQLDTTFNEGNYGPNDMVFIIKKQTDGKILIGGDFGTYNDEDAGNLKRLNPDGTIDNTFFSGYSFNNNVFAIELQGDKILVGGSFNRYDSNDSNVLVNRIARLNSDGTLDSTFPDGNTFNGTVRVITLQPDGKILVGGNFSTYNDGTGSVNSSGLIRLNDDGTVDTSFNVGDGFLTDENGNVYSIIVQDDGKIVVGGWFYEYDGTTAEKIVRLNPDGSNDFTMGNPGFNDRVSRIIQQPDGKFLCVGFFYEYTGTSYNRIIRFNPDGNVDTTFQNNNIDWYFIQAIEILDTGKILIGGSSDNGYVNFSMLNSDGTISDDLNIVSGFDSQVNYILQQDHNKVLVGGWFEDYQGNPVNYLARLWLYDPFSIPISAGTEVFICYENCSGGTVTISVQHPTWTNQYGQDVLLLDAIQLSGNNGYYN